MVLFASDYQGGLYFEVFTAQGSNPLANWKASPGIKKEYDRAVKGYVLEILGGYGCRLQLPNEKLKAMCLLQPVLVLQVWVPEGPHFSLEVAVVDKGSTRRRLVFSTAFSDVKLTPLHCQLPLTGLPRGAWLNLALDLASLTEGCFPGNQLKATELLIINNACKLRRVFTLKQAPPDSDDVDDGSFGVHMPVPRPLDFPPGVEARNRLLCHSRYAASNPNPSRPFSQQTLNPSATAPLTARRQQQEESVVVFGSRMTVAASPMKTARSGRRMLNSDNSDISGLRMDLGEASPREGSGAVGGHGLSRADSFSRPDSVALAPRSNSSLGYVSSGGRTGVGSMAVRVEPSAQSFTGQGSRGTSAGYDIARPGPGSAAVGNRGNQSKLQQRKPPRLEPLDVTAGGPAGATGTSAGGSGSSMLGASPQDRPSRGHWGSGSTGGTMGASPKDRNGGGRPHHAPPPHPNANGTASQAQQGGVFAWASPKNGAAASTVGGAAAADGAGSAMGSRGTQGTAGHGSSPMKHVGSQGSSYATRGEASVAHGVATVVDDSDLAVMGWTVGTGPSSQFYNSKNYTSLSHRDKDKERAAAAAAAAAAEVQTAWEDLPLSRQPPSGPKGTGPTLTPQTSGGSTTLLPGRPHLYSNRDAAASGAELWASAAGPRNPHPPPGRPTARESAGIPSVRSSVAAGHVGGPVTARDMSLRDAAAAAAAEKGEGYGGVVFGNVRASAPTSVNILRQASANAKLLSSGGSGAFSNLGLDLDAAPAPHHGRPAVPSLGLRDESDEDDLDASGHIPEQLPEPPGRGQHGYSDPSPSSPLASTSQITVAPGPRFDFAADPRPAGVRAGAPHLMGLSTGTRAAPGPGPGAIGLSPIASMAASTATSLGGLDSSLDSGIHSALNLSQSQNLTRGGVMDSTADGAYGTPNRGSPQRVLDSAVMRRGSGGAVLAQPRAIRSLGLEHASSPSPPPEARPSQRGLGQDVDVPEEIATEAPPHLGHRFPPAAVVVPPPRPQGLSNLPPPPELSTSPRLQGRGLGDSGGAAPVLRTAGGSGLDLSLGAAGPSDPRLEPPTPSLNLGRTVQAAAAVPAPLARPSGRESFVHEEQWPKSTPLATRAALSGSSTPPPIQDVSPMVPQTVASESGFLLSGAQDAHGGPLVAAGTALRQPAFAAPSPPAGPSDPLLESRGPSRIPAGPLAPLRAPRTAEPRASTGAEVVEESISGPPSRRGSNSGAPGYSGHGAARNGLHGLRMVPDELGLQAGMADRSPLMSPMLEPQGSPQPQDGGASPPRPDTVTDERPGTVPSLNLGRLDRLDLLRPATNQSDLHSSATSHAWEALLDDQPHRLTSMSNNSSPRSNQDRRVSDLDGIFTFGLTTPMPIGPGRPSGPVGSLGYDDRVLWSFEQGGGNKRLYTPPVVPASQVQGGHGGPREPLQGTDVFINEGKNNGANGGAGGSSMMDLIYDPILNCYYDAKTNQYYALL